LLWCLGGGFLCGLGRGERGCRCWDGLGWTLFSLSGGFEEVSGCVLSLGDWVS